MSDSSDSQNNSESIPSITYNDFCSGSSSTAGLGSSKGCEDPPTVDIAKECRTKSDKEGSASAYVYNEAGEEEAVTEEDDINIDDVLSVERAMIESGDSTDLEVGDEEEDPPKVILEDDDDDDEIHCPFLR
uniref:Fgenesh protein 54 n=1 Tax=Beta vulgaris TaxID=161934 RepID=Q1ZY20_BETVU|nr:Fgenesh protein 54 [Beta vulgaris]